MAIPLSMSPREYASRVPRFRDPYEAEEFCRRQQEEIEHLHNMLDKAYRQNMLSMPVANPIQPKDSPTAQPKPKRLLLLT